MPVLDPARNDALEVLGDLAGWELPPDRWPEVSARLTALAAAVLAEDDAAVVAATAALELLSPLMGPGMGKEPTTPPPDEVLEKRVEIVDSLRD
ncbi:CATRA system-associated protein [Actinosynnema sp. CA-299493]